MSRRSRSATEAYVREFVTRVTTLREVGFRAPCHGRLVALVEYLERAVLAAVVPPVQAEPQEDPDGLGADRAARLRVFSGIGVGVLVAGLDCVKTVSTTAGA